MVLQRGHPATSTKEGVQPRGDHPRPLGSGVYQAEAAETLERLAEIYVAPIEDLSDSLALSDETSDLNPYNYNFYIVFGKKLIDYADSLAGQTMIPLAPSALGELDFFSSRIGQSLIQLH